MHRLKRLVAVAVLSMSTALAGMGATYGQDKVVRIGFQKYGKLVLLKGRGTLEEKLKPLGYKVVVDGIPVRAALAGSAQCRRDRFRQSPAKRRRSSRRRQARRCLFAYEPPAPQGEAILVPKDSTLKSVADLKGKKVALNKGSNVHYLLVKALEKAGVKYTDIEPVFLAPADARAAFERGAVDAWVIWDPYRGRRRSRRPARASLPTAPASSPTISSIWPRRSFCDAHPGIVDRGARRSSARSTTGPRTISTPSPNN